MMTEQGGTSPKRYGRKMLIVVAVLSALGGILATKAVGYGVFYWHMSQWHGPIDQERIERKAERAADYLARKVDANDEQKKKLAAITKSLAKDLLPYHEKLRATRGQLKELLTQDSVDREKLEAFRSEKLALMDEMSKRVTVAFADASEVLTPAQRKKLTKKFFRKRHY